MGLALILIGVILWLFISQLLGIIFIVAGLLLLFVPHTYGYSDWRRGRRGPPP